MTDPERPRVRYPKYTKLFSFINAVLCLGVMFVVGFKLVTKQRASGFIQSENRYLAEFPSFSLKSYFKGEYTAGIVTYYTDTIPSREIIRARANRITDRFGFHSKDSVTVYGDAAGAEPETLPDTATGTQPQVTVYTGTQPTETVTTAETVSTSAMQTLKRTEVGAEGEVIGGNVIVYGKGTPEVRAMSVFNGPFERGRRYAGVLNAYKEMAGTTVNVYNLSAPIASAFYMPENLRGQFSDQHDCIKNIGLSLNNVFNVDVYDILAAHSDEYIYFRTDHHWQPLGAYYAAQEFARVASVPFADISSYETCTKENFCGTMYGYTNYLADLQKYPDTFIYYKPQTHYSVQIYDETFSNPQKGSLFYEAASGVNTYSTILGGDSNLTEITSEVQNGRKLILIKNSYGNALVPFLVGSFEKIYVVDFRYVQIPMQDLIRRTGATDLLFGMAISSCYTEKHIDAIEEIMTP